MAKVRFRDKDFNVAEIARLVHYSLHETLLFLGSPKNSKETFVIGLGTVMLIKKGEDFDMVGIDFGKGYAREIYVKNNHARRQIYTLKRGQLAWFYGTMTVYREDGKIRSSLFAKGFQGWYVPKSMDIIKVDPQDIEELTKENESKIDFIDKLISGEEEL